MGPSAAARIGYKRRALRLVQARGQSAVARTDLGSFRMVNCIFGKLPLEKYPWEVAAWEKPLEKYVPH